MARSECPIVVLNSSTGLPVSGASVAIKFRSSGLNATWWTQETGGTSSTAAVTTDANGRVAAWCDRGAYNCTVSGTGITTYTEPWDSTPAADSSIDSLWLPDNVIQLRHMSDNSVGTSELVDSSVTTAKILDGTIATGDLSTTAKQNFMQLFTNQNIKAKWGVTDSGGWGVTSNATFAIPHGLGATPSWASVVADTGVTTGSSDDVIHVSIITLDATNIQVRARTASGGNANFPGVNFYWIVLGNV